MKSNLIKTPEELKLIREGGKILAQIVGELKQQIVVGACGEEIDDYACFLCKRYKVKPAFLNYGSPPFPAVICANLNEVIVHGIPTKTKFRSGDIFGLDMGIIYKGLYLDMSETLAIGDLSEEVQNFLDKTNLSMMQGIAMARPGKTVGDICVAMGEGLLGDNFSLMRDFVGHGTGYNLHEEPAIPGFGMQAGEGMVIESGMVLAIEAISVMGPTNAYDVNAKDHWTVYTKGKKYISGLYEHTVIIGDVKNEIVTLV